MEPRELIPLAAALARPRSLAGGGSAATVAAAIRTGSGRVHTGVCLDLRCGLGFCAERAAAAEMVKSGETTVTMMAAVDGQGRIVPPCGACREFLLQLDATNRQATVVLPDGTTQTLAELRA